MGRSFTKREKVLLIILAVLLVGCFYYLFVLQPALNTISSAESRYTALQDEILIQQTVALKKAELQQQIAEAEAAGVNQKTLPAYDNTKNELAALNGILAEANSYSITFADADTSQSLIRRGVSISFTTDSYAAAQSVLAKLINCQYSCLVTDITITAGSAGSTSSTGSVSSTAAVTFFETLQ